MQSWLSFVTYTILLAAAAVSFFFLSSLVLDITVRCTIMTGLLDEESLKWRDKLLNAVIADFPDFINDDSTRKAVDEYLDVELVAKLTESVHALVYFPPLVILVIFLGQMRFFDNWYSWGRC